MRKSLGYTCELVGLAVVVYGVFRLAPWLGLIALGVALVLAGAVIGSGK